jgi:hypothetical protein
MREVQNKQVTHKDDSKASHLGVRERVYSVREDTVAHQTNCGGQAEINDVSPSQSRKRVAQSKA